MILETKAPDIDHVCRHDVDDHHGVVLLAGDEQLAVVTTEGDILRLEVLGDVGLRTEDADALIEVALHDAGEAHLRRHGVHHTIGEVHDGGTSFGVNEVIAAWLALVGHSEQSLVVAHCQRVGEESSRHAVEEVSVGVEEANLTGHTGFVVLHSHCHSVTHHSHAVGLAAVEGDVEQELEGIGVGHAQGTDLTVVGVDEEQTLGTCVVVHDLGSAFVKHASGEAGGHLIGHIAVPT